MVGEHMTLNELIQVANKKAGADRAVLTEMIARDNIQGTVSEAMSYVDSNREIFEDPHLEDVKTALSKFLAKLPAEKVKFTLASMRRELEEFKTSRPHPKGNGNGGDILSQEDLDALLSQTSAAKPKREPRIIEPIPEKKEDKKSGDESDAASMLDQSDIDALLSGVGSAPPAAPKRTMPAMPAMDQDLVDTILSSRPSSVGANGKGSSTHGGLGGIVSQDDIDALLSGPTAPEEEVDAAPALEEPADTPAPESVELMPAMDEEEPEKAIDEDLSGQNEVDRILMEAANGKTPDEASPETEEPVEQPTAADEPVTPGEGGHVHAAVPTPAVPSGAVSAFSGDHSRQTGDVIMPPAERIVEEKGSSRLIKEFYRIYVRENGSFTTIFEADSRDAVKDELQTLLENYPAKSVFLGKVVQKEVLVIKEDLRRLPISVQVNLGE